MLLDFDYLDEGHVQGVSAKNSPHIRAPHEDTQDHKNALDDFFFNLRAWRSDTFSSMRSSLPRYRKMMNGRVSFKTGQSNDVLSCTHSTTLARTVSVYGLDSAIFPVQTP